jgi:hypothetical protein
MDRIVWWLNFSSIVILLVTAVRLAGVFSEQIALSSFVPGGETVLVMVAGVSLYQSRRGKIRRSNTLE